MLHSNAETFWQRGLAVLAGLLSLSTPAGAGGQASELCVYKGYSDHEIARYPLAGVDRFSLSFIHSVSLTPVTDVYEVAGGAIHQTAEIYEAHGAGLPSFAGDIGQTGWHLQDGKFVMEMDRTFARIQLRIQQEYLNILHIAERDIILAELPGRALGIEICAKEGS